MKQLLLFCLALLSAQFMYGQTNSRDAFPNGAGTVDVPSASFSFSIGQAVVQTLEGDNVIMTQGFQQPDSKGSVGTIDLLPDGSYTIYPNPSIGKFSVEISADEHVNGILSVRNVLGQNVDQHILTDQKYHLENFDLDWVPSGVYVVTLHDNDQNILLNQMITIQNKL